MPIYTNIKKTCKQKGISVTKLEADLGFARSTIYKYSFCSVLPGNRKLYVLRNCGNSEPE